MPEYSKNIYQGSKYFRIWVIIMLQINNKTAKKEYKTNTKIFHKIVSIFEIMKFQI